jgi:maltose-binding protein MalE
MMMMMTMTTMTATSMIMMVVVMVTMTIDGDTNSSNDDDRIMMKFTMSKSQQNDLPKINFLSKITKQLANDTFDNRVNNKVKVTKQKNHDS